MKAHLLEEQLFHVVAAPLAGRQVLSFIPALQQNVVVATPDSRRFQLVLKNNLV
jgi:hypothetical protein